MHGRGVGDWRGPGLRGEYLTLGSTSRLRFLAPELISDAGPLGAGAFSRRLRQSTFEAGRCVRRREAALIKAWPGFQRIDCWSTIVDMAVNDEMPSPGAALLKLARMRAGLTQAELAERAGVARSMVSAYESDHPQATLPTLMRLLKAAGFELRMHLAPYDDHDDVLRALEERRSPEQRQAWETYQAERVAKAKARDHRAIRKERPEPTVSA